MSPAERIRNTAMKIRDALQNRVPGLQRDLDRPEKHKRAIEAQIDAANVAMERIANFTITADRDYLWGR